MIVDKQIKNFVEWKIISISGSFFYFCSYYLNAFQVGAVETTVKIIFLANIFLMNGIISICKKKVFSNICEIYH